jgi:hypothetical protein
MRRVLLIVPVLLAAALPAAAEEIALKDGTKIVGHMTAVLGDKIEVETAYGTMALKRSDILTINFPENNTSNNTSNSNDAASGPAAKRNVQNIEDSLQGTQYVNKTGKFSLTLPVDWKINSNLGHSSSVSIAGLSSRDDMRFLIVSREEYTGSLESYKGLGELQARRVLGGYEEILETPVTIDGKAALFVSYRGTLAQAQNLPVQFLVAIIPAGTTFTRISTWCVEPLFHETQPMFERILTSYRSAAPGSATAEVRK